LTHANGHVGRGQTKGGTIGLVPPAPPRDDAETRQRSSRWRKGLAIGCVMMLTLAVTAAVVVERNWPRLSRVYHRAAAVTSAMFHLITTLQSTYGGAVNVDVKRQSGVDGAILTIKLTNPPFLDQLDPESPAAKAKALEIATTARDALPAPDYRFEHYDVQFVRSSGSAVSVAKSWDFRFEAGDLPPR
jgi:hypothetical protein